MKFLYMTCICLIIGSCAQALKSQPNLPFNLKARVYRLAQFHDQQVQSASGIIFSKGNHYFLITNKHFVHTDTAGYSDSVFLFLNRKVSNKEVVSGPQKVKIFLRKNNISYFHVGSSCTLDLVLIELTMANTTLSGSDSLYSIITSSINSPAKLRQLQTPKSIVTVIGYPGKGSHIQERSPEYLWGDSLKIEDHRILHNAPTTGGNSGSMVLMSSNGTYYLLGIHVGIYKRTGIGKALPASNIFDCFSEYFTLIGSIESNSN